MLFKKTTVFSFMIYLVPITVKINLHEVKYKVTEDNKQVPYFTVKGQI